MRDITFGVGTNPQNLAVNPVENKIYVANSGSNEITLIDGATNQTFSIPVGANPQAVAVNPVTGIAYVPDNFGNSITIISSDSNSAIGLSLAFDSLMGSSVYSAQPSLSGKTMDRLLPASAGVSIVILQSAEGMQNAWTPAPIPGNNRTDSLNWTWNWGNDTLIPGENFVCAAVLMLNTVSMNICGLGTPFVSAPAVLPVYRMNGSAVVWHGAPVSRTMFNLSIGGKFITWSLPHAAQLSIVVFDLQGRVEKVLCNAFMQKGNYRMACPALPKKRHLLRITTGAEEIVRMM